jgi:Common central domain of tyrosinase
MKGDSCLVIGFLALVCANLIEPLFVISADAQVAEANTQLKAEIEINNTPTSTDDYLTWAPTPARIRLVTPNAAAVTVVLTNDPEQSIPAGRDQPLDGNVAFAEKLSKGETAALPTLTLTLPPDGSWVSFFVAGSFPRASTADKDAVIEVHLGDAAGPIVGSQAMMVRVRKNVDRLTVGERNAFLKAVHDLQVEMNAFEVFPQMHDLAARGKVPYQQIKLPNGNLNPKYWPDQAHQGSAFLAWHRAFLLLFERRLQSINPAVTIPYWRLNAPTKAFDLMFLGTNRRAVDTFQTEVIFSPANWLYGWNVSYKDLKTVIRAPKDTSLLHRPNGATLIGDVELFGTTPPYPDPGKFGNFASALEFDPHNRGHGLLGAWHANCLISPADPSFWPFHAEHDRLWAKWQWFYGRFDAEGSSPDSYNFTGVFAPDDPTTTNLGHNLKDTMWPWDGTKGRIMDDANSRANRPDENPFAAFPAAPATGLWPASNTAPQPADMIDYLGRSPMRLPHGVAYDDVPYGVRPQSPPLLAPPLSAAIAGLLEETARDNKESATRRLTALAMLRNADHSQPDAVFQSIASDGAAPLDVRQLAATNLIDVNPARGTGVVLDLIRPGEQGAGAFTAAIIETASIVHHGGKVAPDVAERVHHLLTGVAANTRDPKAVPAAIVLAEMADPNAPKYLTNLLKSTNAKGATRAQIVAAISLAGKGATATLREILEKAIQDNDTETALAALRTLAGDQDTRAFRLKLVDADDNVDPLVNQAAMRSLMHETADLLPKLLIYLEGDLSPTQRNNKLESAGAFRVTIESLRPFSQTQVDGWKKRIRAVRDNAPDPATEFKDALSMTLDVLERAAK